MTLLPPWPGRFALLAALFASLLVSPTALRAAPFDHAFPGYAAILKSAIAGDSVDYPKIRAQLPQLKAFEDQLAHLPASELAAFSRDQQLAFWLNSYNAHVLEIVAMAWPVKSIKDIPDVFTRISFTAAGRQLTLDKLENEIIRPQFHEPRVHFALNCAARSCPPLQPQPFRADRLEAQLEAAAGAYIRDPRHNRIDVATKTASLSKLFSWFAEDFVEKYGDKTPRAGLSRQEAAVLNFVGRYLEGKPRELVLTGTPRVTYLEYDWALNSAP